MPVAYTDPQGQIWDFPDQASLDKYISVTQPPTPTALGKDMVYGAASGAARAVPNMLALPGDLLDATNRNFGVDPNSRATDNLPARELRELGSKIASFPQTLRDKIVDMLYKPRTSEGKFSQAAGEGAVTGLMFPGNKIGPAKGVWDYIKSRQQPLLTSIGGSEGGEVAKQVGSGDDPLAVLGASTVGSFAGGGAGMIGRNVARFIPGGGSPTANAKLNEATREIPEAKWKAAEDMTSDAKAMGGMHLTPGQALNDPALLHFQQGVQINPSSGPKFSQMLERQTEQAADASRAVADQVTTKQAQPAEAAARAQVAATLARRKLEENIANEARPGYSSTAMKVGIAQPPTPVDTGILDASGKPIIRQEPTPPKEGHLSLSSGKMFTEDTAKGLADQIRAHATTKEAAPGGFAERELNKLADSVQKATSPEQVNNIYIEFKKSLDRTGPLADPGATKFTKGQASGAFDMVDKFMRDFETDRTGAQKIYRDRIADQLNPQKRSLVGQIAGKKGIVEDVPTATNRIIGLFENALGNKPTVGAPDIKVAGAYLNNIDPEALPGAMRQMIERKYTSAFQPDRLDASKAFVESLRGGKEQTGIRANFDAMLTAVAEAKGQDPKAAIAGMHRWLDVLEASGRGKISATGALTQAEAGKNVVSDAALAMSPRRGITGAVGMKAQEISQRQVFKAMETIFSSPEGMAKLREISKLRPEQARKSAIINGILTTTRETVEPEGN